MDPSPLLSVKNLRVTFKTNDGDVHAVRGANFEVNRGEVLAIVGESGSGKSVTAMSILGLLPDTATIEADTLDWNGENLLEATDARRLQIRGGEIAMIFQDPLSALNPVHRVGKQVGEMLRIHQGISRSEASKRAVELLDLVGIPNPVPRAKMYPHEFSGGMRQRVMIAMAIANNPDLLIADEPTTALDVTVQAQVLEVLLNIKDEIDSAILLITHDLGVVAGIADRVAVMYAGRIVETGTADDVYYEISHPYTQGLLDSLPRVDDEGVKTLNPIKGAPPSAMNVPSGCPFHPRCPYAEVPGVCDNEEPSLDPVRGAGHLAACHFADRVRDRRMVAS